MRLHKLLLPFLAVILPTIHSHTDKVSDSKYNKFDSEENELSSNSSEQHNLILYQFSNSERFLQFAKHASHSSHRSHSSHSSHKSGSHSSHYSSSDCNGCSFDDNEIEEPVNSFPKMIVRK